MRNTWQSAKERGEKTMRIFKQDEMKFLDNQTNNKCFLGICHRQLINWERANNEGLSGAPWTDLTCQKKPVNFRPFFKYSTQPIPNSFWESLASETCQHQK